MSNEIRRYKRELLKNISLAVIAVLFSLFLLDRAVKFYDTRFTHDGSPAGEAAERFLSPQQADEYKEATKLDLVPYIMFAPKPGFRSDTITVNRYGFRGAEIPEKENGVIRIVVIGGSGAMGYGSSSDETIFSHLLEEKLNAASSPEEAVTYEVINAGLPSFIAFQEFILCALKVIDLSPDVVIVYDGFNDMVGSVLNDRRPGYPWRFGELEKAVNISVTRAFIRKRLANYRPTKKIVEYLERRKLKNLKTRHSYTVNRPAVDLYEKTLDRLAHLLQSYDITPVFAYQASLYLKDPKSGSEQALLSAESENRIAVLEEMLDSGRRAMERAAAKNGVLFIDCSSVFDARPEEIFFDTVHFGDVGQEILAEYLFHELKDGFDRR